MNRHIAFATLLFGGGVTACWFGADSQIALGRLAVATGVGEAAVAWLRRDRGSKSKKRGAAAITPTSSVVVHNISL